MSVRSLALVLIVAACALAGCGGSEPAASTPATGGAPSAAVVGGSAIEFCQSDDGQTVAKSGADVVNAVGAGDAEKVQQLQAEALRLAAQAPPQSACVFTGLKVMSSTLRSAEVEGVDGPALADAVDARLREQGFAVGS